jgi:hypothetical protein
MALCNIVGDLGYLGFAFHAQGIVSVPKLAGALFTMAAHVILLAYGDNQARQVAGERGAITNFIQRLRKIAQVLVGTLPEAAQLMLRAKPVGIPFAMLGMNGAGLIVDAVPVDGTYAGLCQLGLGVCIVVGCAAFAVADFTKGQALADRLLKIGPVFFAGSSVGIAALVVATLNPFLLASLLVFMVSNIAGFYAKISKNEPITAGI